ncbi:hypothetical protein GCM10007036_14850 [Alsobacter metallidurans]|uniref:Uncharacterized protein n=1 Tax=Alsobacter metallidurans TaxID=340221 RepID=A0A917I623_9HYPH|nr:hypothetical protein GCM10007036_14850 [Alsobacter metallidurans]
MRELRPSKPAYHYRQPVASGTWNPPGMREADQGGGNPRLGFVVWASATIRAELGIPEGDT